MLLTALAGCGGSGGKRTPNLARVPLVSGAHVVARVKECDSGASAYCAIQLVVADEAYHSADDFLLSERAYLHAHGWSGADGDTGEESAADSPGHKLHLTYATASGDLDGVDLGWIRRSRSVTLALSRAIFDRRAALSLLLETGSG